LYERRGAQHIGGSFITVSVVAAARLNAIRGYQGMYALLVGCIARARPATRLTRTPLLSCHAVDASDDSRVFAFEGLSNALQLAACMQRGADTSTHLLRAEMVPRPGRQAALPRQPTCNSDGVLRAFTGMYACMSACSRCAFLHGAIFGRALHSTDTQENSIHHLNIYIFSTCRHCPAPVSSCGKPNVRVPRRNMPLAVHLY
jgi:hypothetical protein